MVSDDPGHIDYEICGNAVHTVGILDSLTLIFGDEHHCGRRFLLQIERNEIIFLVHADLDDDHIFVLVLILNLLKVRILRTARPSPRCPEIEQYDLALVVGQVHFLAGDVRKLKRRRGLALEGTPFYVDASR